MRFPKTHIHLGVGDAERSAVFYEALLGAPPASRSETVAVFELDTPPLVLTVERTTTERRVTKVADVRAFGEPPANRSTPRRGAPQPRFALFVNEPRLVGDAAIALRRAGARLRLEDEGIEVYDPDGNAWRIRFVPSVRGREVVAT